MNSIVEYDNKEYTYCYKNIHYELPSTSILLEIKRLDLLNQIKRELKKIVSYNKTFIDIENIFPRWIMTNIGGKKYLVDPLIPYNPDNFDQLKIDIKNLSKRKVNDNEINKILKEFDLKKRCNEAIFKLRKFIQSDFYIDNHNQVIIKIDYQNKKYILLIKYTNQLEKYSALIEYSQLRFTISERVYNKFLDRYINSSVPDNLFRQLIFIISLRYFTLNSLNQQLAVASTFYKSLRKRYSCNFELFASSINCYFDNYCSLFPDLEKYFKSKGSFSHFKPTSGFYVLNPPYDETIMKNASQSVVTWLKDSKKYLSFLFVIPAWDKDEEKYGVFEALAILKREKAYFKYQRKILKKDARFIDYMLDKVIYPVDVYVILMSNQCDFDTKELNKLIDLNWLQRVRSNNKKKGGGVATLCKEVDTISKELKISPIKYLKLPKVTYKPLQTELKISDQIPMFDHSLNYYTLLTIRTKERDLSEKLVQNTMRLYMYNFSYLINTMYYSYRTKQYVKNPIQEKVYFRKSKYGKIPYVKSNRIIPVVKFQKDKISDYIKFITTFMIKELISDIEYNPYSNLYIMDLTETDKLWEKSSIKDRLKQYSKSYFNIISEKCKLTALNTVFITASKNFLQTIKNIKKLERTNNLTIITGTHPYDTRKESYAIDEQSHYQLFFTQIFLLLNIQNIGSSFIMFFTHFNTSVTHQLFYLLSLYYEECYIVKGLVDSNSTYFVGKKFTGIKTADLKKLEKIYLRLNSLFKKQGKYINIKDDKIRDKLCISKKKHKHSIYKYISSFLKNKIPTNFTEKLNKFAKTILQDEINSTILVNKLTIAATSCTSKDMNKFYDQMQLKQIIFALKYCKERNIPINPLYNNVKI